MQFSFKKYHSFSISFLLLLLFKSGFGFNTKHGYYYQIKIYHLKTKLQEERLDHYLEKAYLPALHEVGIKSVGVFKPVIQDTADQKIYVLIPFSSLKELTSIDEKLNKDQQYLANGKDYIEANYKDAPFTRIENIILNAFPKMPEPAVPQLTAAKPERVYELRSYESATEKYNINKVKMFNDGNEVALFKRLGFNAVFYAEVIAGSHMPNLMYMTTFNNKQDRDKHWETFNNDPEWKALVAKSEYQNNVSHNEIVFLHPTSYSDF
ncbi:NIPSNAP family protein [Mucilaginibacter arboris]|uniref:NIPSNAP family containing protein n=1 Tax=Mucilaginibacter arboris TaxID=2682090 RepID=A0A7K1SZB6_9SPHI|nr:NIPSNAP family protein [Mucilaginibacter arboris]MVN22661.1 NIPSNAP family containing protein [Mucilaginibacter arboris]